MVGNLGADRLIGGRGRDRLAGGKGFDRFAYNHPREGGDRITDFSVQEDAILVSARGFKAGIRVGEAIRKNQFHIGTEATTRTHSFIYNSRTGNLFFDTDGIGATRPIQIAQLPKKLSLTHLDVVGF